MLLVDKQEKNNLKLAYLATPQRLPNREVQPTYSPVELRLVRQNENREGVHNSSAAAHCGGNAHARGVEKLLHRSQQQQYQHQQRR